MGNIIISDIIRNYVEHKNPLEKGKEKNNILL